MPPPVGQWTVARRTASAVERPPPCSHQPTCTSRPDGGHQLVESRSRLRVAGAADHAVVQVLVEQADRHALQSTSEDGRDLREDVDAVGLLVDEALQPPHLALDAAETLEHRRFVVGVAGSLRFMLLNCNIPPWGIQPGGSS